MRRPRRGGGPLTGQPRPPARRGVAFGPVRVVFALIPPVTIQRSSSFRRVSRARRARAVWANRPALSCAHALGLGFRNLEECLRLLRLRGLAYKGGLDVEQILSHLLASMVPKSATGKRSAPALENGCPPRPTRPRAGTAARQDHLGLRPRGAASGGDAARGDFGRIARARAVRVARRFTRSRQICARSRVIAAIAPAFASGAFFGTVLGL